MPSRRPLSRRPGSRLVLLSGVLASLAGSLLVPLTAEASGPTKTTICHRTSSHTNPYRRITVAQSALIRAHGHGDHTGPLWVAGGPKGWGDVIPGVEAGGDPARQLNWPAGQAIYRGTVKAGTRAACGFVSAARYVATERAEGVSDADIVDELNDQSANEDRLLLEALGLKAFTVASLDDLGAVSATTSAVRPGEVHATTAVLHGSVGSGPTVAVRSFTYGTDPDLVDASTAAAGQGTGTADTTATVTGLQPGTTYYYRAVGTAGAGGEHEAVLEGEVLSFTTLAQDVPVAKKPQDITLGPLGGLVVGTPVDLPSATAGSGLQVTIVSRTPDVCELDAGRIVPVEAGATCRITVDQSGDSAWEAAQQAAWEVLVTAAPPAGRTQTLTFEAPDARPWTAPDFSVDPRSDAELPVVVSSRTQEVCTTTGERVTLHDVGTCVLAADADGAGDVLPAETVTAGFEVQPAPQQVVFGVPVGTEHAVGSVELGATATSRLAVDLSVEPGEPGRAEVCSLDGTTLRLERAGSCTVTARQGGDRRWHAAAVRRTFTVTSPSVPVVPVVPVVPGQPSPPAPTPEPTPDPTPTPSVPPVLPVPPVQRVEGRERTETSAQLARSMYPEPGTARVVVLARSDVYADGLTGSPLAGTLDGPVLLTAPDRLPGATAAAIRAVLAADGTVVVLGGPRAVTPAVVEQVRRLGYRTERIGGVDRYDTATLIADRIDATTSVRQVYLATGTSFPDALSAASAAEVTGGVVLLTRGTAMPGVTSSWLTEHGTQRRTAVGGAAATAAPQAERIVGRDRYTTAALVAEAVLPEADGVVMVTGTDFPDGLAGASYAARNAWPMLLVNPTATALTPGQDAYLERLRGGVKDLVAIGGSTALPPAATGLITRRLDRVATP